MGALPKREPLNWLRSWCTTPHYKRTSLPFVVVSSKVHPSFGARDLRSFINHWLRTFLFEVVHRSQKTFLLIVIIRILHSLVSFVRSPLVFFIYVLYKEDWVPGKPKKCWKKNQIQNRKSHFKSGVVSTFYGTVCTKILVENMDIMNFYDIDFHVWYSRRLDLLEIQTNK